MNLSSLEECLGWGFLPHPHGVEDFSLWLRKSHHTSAPSASRTDRWKLIENCKLSTPSGRQLVTCLWKWKLFLHRFLLWICVGSSWNLYQSWDFSTWTDFIKYQQKVRVLPEYVYFMTLYWTFGIAFTSKMQPYLNEGQGSVLFICVQSCICLQLHMAMWHQRRGVKRLRDQIAIR